MVEATKNVDVPKAKLREIFSTPSECFHFLTLEVGYHLPPRPYTDMDFMSEIWDGTRKAIKSEDVDSRRIPHFKQLRIDDLLNFIKENGSECYLNPPKKKKVSEKWSRPWLCDVSHVSLVGDLRIL